MSPSAPSTAELPRRLTAGDGARDYPARLSASARRLGRAPGLAWVLALAVIAGLATWVATRHGPGLSPDSVTYLSAARNLAAGHGYLDLTGQANTTFAPGYPAMLAAGQVIGLSLMTAARLINAGSFAAIVLLSWLLLRRHVTSPRLLLAATAAVALSPAVLNVADEAWSEPLFCVVLLVFVLVLEDVVAAHPPSARLVATAGFIAGVAFLVRYAASALILTGVVVLLLSRRPVRWPTRWLQVGVFLLGAAPFPALWVLRNATSGSPYVLGPRVAVTSSLWNLVGLLLSGVKELLVPTAATALWAIIALPMAVVLAVGATTAIRAHARHQPLVGSRSVAPLLGFVGVYAAVVLIAGKVSGASIDVRTIMPIYLPLLIVGAWLVEEARQGVPRATRLWGRPGVGLAVAGAALVFYGGWFLQVSWADGSVARGYAAPTVVSSPLAAAVRRLPAGALVVTNAPWSLYYGSEHQPIVPAPGPLAPAASLVPATLDVLTDASCSHAVYGAWFGRKPPHATPGSSPRPTGVRVLTARDGVLEVLRPQSLSCENGSASALRSSRSAGRLAGR
jgi:hypothetical protein